MRLRHFRKGAELPWILNDETYDADFQENRPLSDLVRVEPEDHLSLGNNIYERHAARLHEFITPISLILPRVYLRFELERRGTRDWWVRDCR